MSNIRLKDLLKNKKEGEQWYCLEAPEDVRVWINKHPWDKDTFRERGVSVVAISVKSDAIVAFDEQKFNYKSQLKLDCGVEITNGKIKTRQRKSSMFNIRVDSCVEFNEVMEELSKKTGLDSWDINKIKIYNDKEAIFTSFKLHNPDGNGTGMFTHRFTKDKFSRLYPDVVIADQKRFVGNFYNNIAHCTAAKPEGLVHSCALENKKKIKKRQTILRKRKQSDLG